MTSSLDLNVLLLFFASQPHKQFESDKYGKGFKAFIEHVYMRSLQYSDINQGKIIC